MNIRTRTQIALVVSAFVSLFGVCVLLVGGVLNVGGPRTSAWIWGAVFTLAGLIRAVFALMQLKRQKTP